MTTGFLLLAGCAKKSDNTIADVGKIEETKVENFTTIQEVTKDVGEYLNGVDKQMVGNYLSDGHFYDETELDYVYIGNDGEEQLLHIFLEQAVITEKLSELGEYFEKEETAILEKRESIVKLFGYDPDALAFLCVPVKITNRGSETEEINIGNLRPSYRVKDDRLIEYGLADKRLDGISKYTEFWYDYPDKKNGKGYYVLSLEPGQSMETKLLYLIDKTVDVTEMYLRLFDINGEYDENLKCYLPSTLETVKYIKIDVEEEVQ